MSEKPNCYFRSKNKVIGPTTTTALKRLAEQGRVTAKHLIRHRKDGEWVEAWWIGGLKPYFEAPLSSPTSGDSGNVETEGTPSPDDSNGGTNETSLIVLPTTSIRTTNTSLTKSHSSRTIALDNARCNSKRKPAAFKISFLSLFLIALGIGVWWFGSESANRTERLEAPDDRVANPVRQAVAPEPHPKAEQEPLPKINAKNELLPKEKKHWETPTDLVFFINQKIDETWKKDFALGEAVDVLLRTGEINQAMETSKKIENFRTRANSLKRIGPYLVKAGDVEQYLEMTKKFKDGGIKLIALTYFSSPRKVTNGHGLWRKALAEDKRVGVRRRSGSLQFDITLHLAEAGEIIQALETAKKIEDEFYKVSALSVVASAALTKSDNKDQALGILRQALSAAIRIEDARYGTVALNRIALVLVEAGEKEQSLLILKNAIEMAQEIEDKSFKDFALKNVAKTLISPTPYKPITFKYGGSLELVDTLRSLKYTARDVRNEKFNLKEKQLAKQLVEAVKNEVRAPQPKVVAIPQDAVKPEPVLAVKPNPVLKAKVAIKAANPWDTADQLKRFVDGKIDRSNKKAPALKEVVSTLLSEGEIEQALEVAQKIVDTKLRSESMYGIALARIKAGQIKHAVETVVNVNDSRQKEYVVDKIISALRQPGNQNQRLETLKQVIEMVLQLKDQSSSRVKSRLKSIFYLATPRDRKRAFAPLVMAAEEAKKAEDARKRAFKINGAVLTLLSEGEIQQAINVAIEIEVASIKAFAMREIASALVKLGNKEQAFEILEKTLELIQKIEGPSYKSFALGATAVALVETGNKEKVRIILNQLSEKALKIKDARYGVVALNGIAVAQAKLGDKKQALATLKKSLELSQEIKEALDKAFAIRGIGSYQSTAGDKEQALASLNQAVMASLMIELKDKKVSALTNIASVQIDAGDKEQALATLEKAFETSLEIEIEWKRIISLKDISQKLVSTIPGNPPSAAQLKQEFDPVRKQLAKQIVQAMQ